MELWKVLIIVLFYFIILYSFRMAFTLIIIKLIIKTKERITKEIKEKAKDFKEN